MPFKKIKIRNPFHRGRKVPEPRSSPVRTPAARSSGRPGGPSLRRKCFEAFDRGERPMAYARENHLKLSTALTYFRDWKRIRGLSPKAPDPAPARRTFLDELLDRILSDMIARAALRAVQRGEPIVPGAFSEEAEPPRRTKRPAAGGGRSRSLSRRAHLCFDLGLGLEETAELLDADRDTLRRYRGRWRHLPAYFWARYEVLRKCYRSLGPDERKLIARALASELGTSSLHVLERLRKPWALRDIASGGWIRWELPSPKSPPLLGIVERICLGMRLLRASPEVKAVLQLALRPDEVSSPDLFD